MPPPPFKPKGPPAFKPTRLELVQAEGDIIPHDLNLEWGVDPFDERFVDNAPGLPLTPLGVLMNALWWWEKNQDKVTPHAAPMINQFRYILQRHCPDALAEMYSYLEKK